MKDGKFETSDFFDVRFHRVDDNITRERFAQKVNALLEAEREKMPVVYGRIQAPGETAPWAWDDQPCASTDTHSARLCDIREIRK